MSVKTCNFFLRDFHRATTLATHLPIFNSYFNYSLFPLPSSSPHLYHVFPIHSGCLTTSYIKRRRQCNFAHLQPICTSSSLPLSFSIGLWNCQSAVNKADLIPTFASQTALSILGLTETWIRPEDSETPAALSNNLFFSHTPRQVRKGGGTGLLISKYFGNTQLILPYAIITHWNLMLLL